MALNIRSLVLQQLLSVFIVFLILPTILLAVTTISPGSTLYASNTTQIWSSPNNTFSVGFIPLNSTNSPPSFMAAIVYSGGIPIWSAGTTPVDSAAYFQFHPTAGDLRLVNGSGHTVWNSSTVGLGVSSASLDDHGNLILMRNATFPVWSSFDHPTDTIVPTQNFSTRNVLRNGLFSFNLLEYGNITLKWNDTTGYWSQGLGNSSHGENLTSPSLGLLSNGTLSVFDRSIPGRAVLAYSNNHDEGSDMLRFLRLDNDGNLRIYSSARGSGTSTVRWVSVKDQCRVFGYCGDMGICSYNGTNPICTCPSENFEQVDPNDSRKGCQRKMKSEDCPGNLTMLVMEHTLFLTYPPQSIFAVEGSQVFFVGISACRSNCLVDRICDASTILSDGTGMCYYKYKQQGSITGYYNPALPSTSYVKVCSPAVQNPLPYVPEAVRDGENRGMKARAVAAVVLGSVLGWFALAHTFCLWWNRTKFGKLSEKHALLEYASCAPIQFSYKELRRSTKGFTEKLGNGGFGAVYRGTLPNRAVVAVKRLEEMEQMGEREFKMQIATISSTHHLNLVRLIGFCCERRHRLLVYEFMQNKSLDICLFQTGDEKLRLGRKLLSWDSRFNIALGIARGITYLHDECRDCTVHCDIKPENILLDENYTAKVSDFGLAKLDHHMTSVMGTRGYLAPEWLANLPLTTKSDVYSYGMVLLEIVSGRRNFEVSAETNWRRFSLWAYEEFEKGNVKGVLDRRLVGNDDLEMEVDMEEVVRAIQVSFLCIQEQPSRRPRIGTVVQMLQGITRIDWPPVY